MLNLNVGGVVFHAGKKRTIEAVKDVVGQTFLKLNGHAYLVRLEHVKPVVRLTDVVRANLIVSFCAAISTKIPQKEGLLWDAIGYQDKKVPFEQYVWAKNVLFWDSVASNIVRSGRLVGRGPANTYARYPSIGGSINA